MNQPSTESKQEAKDVVIKFMDSVEVGDGYYSCSKCQLDTYLCPHLADRLQDLIAVALDAAKAVGVKG